MQEIFDMNLLLIYYCKKCNERNKRQDGIP